LDLEQCFAGSVAERGTRLQIRYIGYIAVVFAGIKNIDVIVSHHISVRDMLRRIEQNRPDANRLVA
jgi:hypothetical protein